MANAQLSSAFLVVAPGKNTMPQNEDIILLEGVRRGWLSLTGLEGFKVNPRHSFSKCGEHG